MAVALAADRGLHTRRKVAVRLLPFLFVLYVVAYLDRTNISTAALQMPRELGFDDRVFGLGAGIFFAGYFLLEVPGALIVERWSARRWMARIMVTWGIISVGMAFIHTPRQFYVMRFLLGVAEAGFFPGMIVYLTHWFVYADRAKAVANFMAAIPVSVILGSPLSGWLLGMHWAGLSGWRWLFVLEGAPAIVLGIVTWFYLTDWPHQAKWLNPEAREWTVRALEQEKATKKAVRSYTVWQALRDRDVLVLTVIYFIQVSANYSFAIWLPTMVKRLSGLTDLRVAWLVTIPNALGLIAMQINGWHSDRTGERRWHTALPLFASSACLLAIATFQPGTVWIFVGYAAAITALMCFMPTFWPIPTSFLSESAAAACIGTMNCLGLLGGFAGPYLLGYISHRTNSFRGAFVVMLVALFAAGLLTLTLRPRRLETKV